MSEEKELYDDKNDDVTAETETEETEEVTEESCEAEENSEEAETEEKSEEKKGFFKKKKDKKDEKIEELTDRVKRQMAEFDNFRKRTEKEKASMYEIGAREIIEKILPIRETGRILFTVGSIDYLQHGGRIGKLAGIAAGALGIKPMITLKEGEIFSSGLARGRVRSMKKVVDMTREYLDEVNAKPGEYSFCIGYGYDYEEAVKFREMLKNLVKERLGIEKIGIYQIGATIGVHTGPYPIGIGIIKHAVD